MARINHYREIKEMRQALTDAFKKFKADDKKEEYKNSLVAVSTKINNYINSKFFSE